MRYYPHILIFIVKIEELMVEELVMLARDQSVPTKTIPSLEDIEVISVQLLTQHPVKICLVYNSPDSGRIYQHKLISVKCDIIK